MVAGIREASNVAVTIVGRLERSVPMASVTGSASQRQRIVVQGIVQGVGFRPFVYAQALRHGLSGFVLNDSQGVTIEVEGSPSALAHFHHALHEEAPPLARIDSVVTEQVQPRHETAFLIAHSQAGNQRHALISPDTAICEDCLSELFDPTNRRYLYPFINCTNCGPRFTIVQDVPYDRVKTTMRAFPMCATCQEEYENPLNRRFHAQPNACPVCGPQVRLLDWTHGDLSNPIATAAQQLAAGTILAIKGLGGYHLACDALNTEAVQRLRQRKHREAKPFALMVPDLATARELCIVSDAEADLLLSHRRPIVLLKQRFDKVSPLAAGVAPAYDTLGIMLPYTPLHYLLLHAFVEALPVERLAVLVMTSGNLSDEPIAYQDDDARNRLATIADGMLRANRDIHMRCDDSVMRVSAGGPQFLRRSRGYAPEPIPLAFDFPQPLLACGGHLKNTFCLGKGRQAFVSHHIGDLENLETLTSYKEGIAHFQNLFDIYPTAVVYDLHPDYLATRYALDTAITQKIGVQHHHAHIASVLAEHHLVEPVIGVAADGTGYGTDGTVWGGEILVADLLDFERVAHLRYIPLPGGEQAIRQPWRMAAAYLAQAYGDAFLDLDMPFVQQLDRSKWHVLSQMMASKLNSPPTSSMGRLFDAVAALLGLPTGVAQGALLYEGQAAIELEVQANKATSTVTTAYPFTIEGQSPTIINVAPLICAIVHDIQQGIAVPQIALRFHYSVAELLAVACAMVRQQTGLHTVTLSGGVFQNQLLLAHLQTRLEAMAFQVYSNRRVPPNDGGLSLGQIAIGAARLRTMLQ